MYQYFSNNGYGGYPQPMQTPVPIQQSQTTTFINVPSEDVAFRWNVSPNNSVNFINENQGYLYKKSVGMSILEPPVFEVYRIEKIGDNVPAPVQEVSPPDIIDMKMEDIDKKNRVVHLQSGKDVCVPQDFVDIAAEADKQTVYTGLTDSNFEIQLIPSLTIYKQKNNSQGSDPNRTIYNTIVRNINAIDELSEVITSKSIRDSGLIHYLNQRADKLHTTVEEMFVTCDNCRDILEKYNLNPMTRKRWRIQYKEFLR